MKTIALIFTLVAAYGQAQWLSTPTVIPQSPTPADSVQIIIETFTPNQGHKLGRSFSVQKTGLIIINICNYDGMATAIDQYIDTFQVGQLPAGNYSLQVNYSTSWDTQLCLAKSDTAAGHQFTVQTVTGMVENNSNAMRVFPNPVRDELRVETGRMADLEILDLHGKVVIRSEIRKEKTISVKSLPPGIYLIREKGRETRPAKLLVE